MIGGQTVANLTVDHLTSVIGVKRLHIGSSQALTSGGGELVLPELQKLEVLFKIDDVINALTAFIETRESVGRHIDMLVPLRMRRGDTSKLPSESLRGEVRGRSWSIAGDASLRMRSSMR